MDERQESQKDKIKKQVDINKSHTLDETNLGSQNGAVNHFGVQRNDKNSEEDKQNIINKINATKARNLQQSGSASYVPNYEVVCHLIVMVMIIWETKMIRIPL